MYLLKNFLYAFIVFSVYFTMNKIPIDKLYIHVTLSHILSTDTQNYQTTH